MWNMIWPILVVIFSNVLYNICTKETPTEVNLFASFTITYLVSTICAAFLFFITSMHKNIFLEMSKTNWSAYALGLSIVGIEFGFVYIYRVGWKMSTANLISSAALSCVLILIGFLFYKEVLNLRQIFGIIVCLIGLFLITK